MSFSWRQKSIDEFKLQPIPSAWKDEVAVGSEDLWEKYYKIRSQIDTKPDFENDDFGDLLELWYKKMDLLLKQIFVDDYKTNNNENEETPPKWSCTLEISYAREQPYYDNIFTATLNSWIWSPFAIPSVIGLEHRFHSRPRHSTYEFYCDWLYNVIDLDDDSRDLEMKELCSCCFEDEVLRAYVIKTPGLNQTGTLNRLRKVLFGSKSDASKQATCSDYDFLLLLLGSMGTFNYNTFFKSDDGYGWEWSPRIYLYRRKKKKWLQPMIDGNLLRPGSHTREDCHKFNVTWLEYHVRKVTNALRLVDKYYCPPRPEDALGYESPEEEEYDDSDEYSDDDPLWQSDAERLLAAHY